jgi:hypothetical protein
MWGLQMSNRVKKILIKRHPQAAVPLSDAGGCEASVSRKLRGISCRSLDKISYRQSLPTNYLKSLLSMAWALPDFISADEYDNKTRIEMATIVKKSEK